MPPDLSLNLICFENNNSLSPLIKDIASLWNTISKEIFSARLKLKSYNKNWETVKLKEIVSFFKGSSLAKNDIVDLGQNKCIHYGELFTTYREVIHIVISRTNKDGFHSKSGDILMPSSDVTPQGLATASTVLEDGIILGGDINVLRPVSKINPVFLSYLINYNKKKIIEMVSGTTVKHIYSKDLKEIELKIPISIEEQSKISNILTGISEKIRIEREILTVFQQQKKYFLKTLFI